MKTLARKLRPWHRRISVLITLPLFVTIVTGLLLLSRAFNPWVQPPAVARAAAVPRLSFDQIIGRASLTWPEVRQIDVRPDSGLIRVRTKTGWEIQLDADTGDVLRRGRTRSSLLTSLHEGAYFGAFVHYGVFGLSGLGLLGLLLSGMVIYLASWRRQ